MIRRRLPLALLLPTGLVLLVGVLAFFQYKWLGQVSEAERGRLRTTLNLRAKEFADEFDKEIGRAYVGLQMDSDTIENRDGKRYAKRYAEWKASAKFPGMVRAIYLTGDLDSASPLVKFDSETETFVPSPWPAALTPVKERVTTSVHRMRPPSGSGSVQFVSIGQSPVVADVPALVMAMPNIQRVFTSSVSGMTLNIDATFVVVELDRAFMLDTMVPALVDRHFSVDAYHVAVVDNHAPGRAIFSKGESSTTSLDPTTADAATAFFAVRSEGLRDALFMKTGSAMTSTSPTPRTESSLAPLMQTRASSPTPPSTDNVPVSSRGFSIVVQERGAVEGFAARAGAAQVGLERPQGTQMFSTASPGAWELVLQHPAGSLEAAVSHARIKNLSLSFGVLAVLTAGVFLVTINAQRAQRLAAQQMDFVATVSHELRTPLAVIRSAAQNLSAGVVHEPAQAKRYGDLIDAEGRRLTEMVEQVLTYAGMSDAKRAATTVPTDIVWLTNDVVSSCQPLIDEAHKTDGDQAGISVFNVETSFPEKMSDIPLDEAAYRRALSNLIVNALKYGADGEWLGISIKMAVDRSGKPEVQVSVSDRGRGIDTPDLPHIFEAFYRGQYAKERQIHGNGLGLSLVKGIAESHGGRVTVKSTPGAGATFTLHLPA